MTPVGVVRLPAFHIGKQGVVSLIHSVFGFLYFSCPRHDLDSTTPPEKPKGRKPFSPGLKVRSSPPGVLSRSRSSIIRTHEDAPKADFQTEALVLTRILPTYFVTR